MRCCTEWKGKEGEELGGSEVMGLGDGWEGWTPRDNVGGMHGEG